MCLITHLGEGTGDRGYWKFCQQSILKYLVNSFVCYWNWYCFVHFTVWDTRVQCTRVLSFESVVKLFAWYLRRTQKYVSVVKLFGFTTDLYTRPVMMRASRWPCHVREGQCSLSVKQNEWNKKGKVCASPLRSRCNSLRMLVCVTLRVKMLSRLQHNAVGTLRSTQETHLLTYQLAHLRRQAKRDTVCLSFTDVLLVQHMVLSRLTDTSIPVKQKRWKELPQERDFNMSWVPIDREPVLSWRVEKIDFGQTYVCFVFCSMFVIFETCRSKKGDSNDVFMLFWVSRHGEEWEKWHSPYVHEFVCELFFRIVSLEKRFLNDAFIFLFNLIFYI